MFQVRLLHLLVHMRAKDQGKLDRGRSQYPSVRAVKGSGGSGKAVVHVNECQDWRQAMSGWAKHQLTRVKPRADRETLGTPLLTTAAIGGHESQGWGKPRPGQVTVPIGLAVRQARPSSASATRCKS